MNKKKIITVKTLLEKLDKLKEANERYRNIGQVAIYELTKLHIDGLDWLRWPENDNESSNFILNYQIKGFDRIDFEEDVIELHESSKTNYCNDSVSGICYKIVEMVRICQQLKLIERDVT